jgi:opacity protein-like surface antigen
MLNAFRRSCVQDVLPALSLPAFLLLGILGIAAVSTAHAQATSSGPTTPLKRQLERLDLGVSGSDFITKGVSGPNYVGTPDTLNTSTTLGALIQVRYVRSPLVGFEFNYGYARLTENFNFATTTPFGPPAGLFPVQTQMNEYTFGYLAHLPRFSFHGIQPFVGGGIGTTAFKPTSGGGEGLPEKARMTYYYTVGAEDMVSRHFGVRLQFRQLFYKDPDFGQNYLTIQQQTITSEPTFGFFLKY